ncbi:hypothetical protein BDV59DRAFT_190521 [Aspergillus ambiguus]|uniref:uncharacterized protein n=1 Tax=Aspergillus ambiguus TaxID=176160 RepID=UPI003CCD4E94
MDLTRTDLGPVSHHTPGAFDESHEVHDPSTFTTHLRQRQQQAASHPASGSRPHNSSSARPLSAHGSTRSLRRTSRLAQRPASVDASGRPSRIEQSIPVLVQPISDRTTGIAALRPALSEPQTDDDHDHEDADSALDEYNRLVRGESYWPPRSTRVSPRTASAILWVLEEGIRKPFPFTPDWDEVNASMSELAGVPGSIGLGGAEKPQYGASRAAKGPVPVNPHPPSGVRTPTDIMRQRRDREARKRAEQEARDREQEEAERGHQEAQPQAQAQTYAAGVAGERTSQRRAPAPRAPPTGSGAQPTGPATTIQQPPGISEGSRRPDHGHTPSQPKPPMSSAQPTSSQQAPLHASAALPKQGQAASSIPPTTTQSHQQPRRAAFPHAFERWETLSSHWEGLTGYWIRKLEQNNEAMERDPISQQMARQVTDLSAAGANLFHAVRKFQRWFFDTPELERQLRTERQAPETDKTRAEDLLKEMRRELQISKEEARRAWEELGRREQEERDRTNSLRNGEPTLVGIPHRPGSSNRPPTRGDPYAGAEDAGKVSEGQYYEQGPASPTGTDPFTESAGPSAQETHFEYYEEHGMYPGRPSSENDDRSYGPSAGSSEPGEEEYTSYRRTQPPPLVYPPAMSEERYVPSSMPGGSGWGVGAGWDDVIEEEEPRTTPSRASRASQASRSVH